MSGEMDLKTLLASMEPVLSPETFVFVSLPDRTYDATLNPLMVFQEAEGTTLILEQERAQEAGLRTDFSCRRITLNVHSALEAVGFIAHIATALAAKGMGVNPVAGYFHDHLFVPLGRENDALEVLAQISQSARGS